MALDPLSPLPLDRDARTADRLAELERRVAVLERHGTPVVVGAGSPAADPNTLREGTRYIDRTARRLYFVVGAAPAAAWRYVTLT